MQKIEENVNFLRSVPLLKHLSNNLLAKIADVLEVVMSIRRTRKKQQTNLMRMFITINRNSIQLERT